MSVFKWSEALRSVKKEVRPGEALPALLWRFSTWFSVPDSKQPTYASSKENTDSYRKILLNSMQKKKKNCKNINTQTFLPVNHSFQEGCQLAAQKHCHLAFWYLLRADISQHISHFTTTAHL